jgi:hypothetical protein
MPLPGLQRDVLAHAVNERLDELTWQHRVRYSRTVRHRGPVEGPLAALVTLIDGMRLAPPERLPAVAAAAGRSLGVQVVIHLVDYEQRRLISLPAEGQPAREPLVVDTTLAGRAFRLVETLSAEAGGEARLWVPLLGRTAAAELIWHLYPSLTAGTDSFVLAGLVEPSYEVGGDAFDYALSEATAHLAIFDAVGHSLASGIVAATALAASRSTRRNGGSLFAQATAIDDAVIEAFRRPQPLHHRGAGRAGPGVRTTALYRRGPPLPAAHARREGGETPHGRSPAPVRPGNR